MDFLTEIKKLEGQGIFAHEPESTLKRPGLWLSVWVTVMIPETSEAKALEWNIDIINKSGATVTLCDWDIRQNLLAKQKQLRFRASIQIPDNNSSVAYYLATLPPVQTSFADLCWFQGHESIKSDHEPEVTTALNPEASYGDLGWALPCRAVDLLIAAFGKANDALLSGVLEDAIIEGPYITGVTGR